MLLLDALFANPFITVARAEGVQGVSNPPPRQLVSCLEREKMLSVASSRSSGRMYVALSILTVLGET